MKPRRNMKEVTYDDQHPI